MASRPDASKDVQLNGVRLPDGRLVAWSVAHPRPEHAKEA